MKKAFDLLASSMFLLLAASPQAHAGGESSAGADDYRILPAFFIGYEGALAPVRTCFAVTDQFGIDAAAIKPMIQSAFDQWGAYLHTRNLDTMLPSSQRIRSTLQFQDCDGSEELKFFFGIVNDEVTPYKNQFTQPFGFAALTSINPAHGIVWVTPSGSIQGQVGTTVPNWSATTEDALAGLILHEVGHVFGNGHVDDTAMTSQIGQFLENDTSLFPSSRVVNLYSKIDSVRDLILCMDCDESYAAAPKFDQIYHPDSDWANTFKLLVGRDPVLPLSIRFDRNPSLSGAFRYPGSGDLVVTDAQGTYHFAINTETRSGGDEDSAQLFDGQGGKSFNSSSVSFYGEVKANSGSSLPVAISYNMDHVKAQIVPLGQGFYGRPLFVSAE